MVRGKFWDESSDKGNPAAAHCIKQHVKLIQEEQAAAHVVPKQTKPIFLGKVKRIASYIDNELGMVEISLKERYVLLRDQAWMKLQFFRGNRANNLAMLVGQEVKRLDDNSGLVIKQTFGKTLRGNKHKSHIFVNKRCRDKTVCPVIGLHTKVQGCKRMGVDLANGFLFRVVLENGRVIGDRVTYSVMYERLIQNSVSYFVRNI